MKCIKESYSEIFYTFALILKSTIARHTIVGETLAKSQQEDFLMMKIGRNGHFPLGMVLWESASSDELM